MTETNVMRSIMKACSRGAVRLFRNNVAMAWVGKGTPHRGAPVQVTLHPGDILLRDARPLHAGLCVGSGDLIGWKAVVVTPDMVGKKIALFASLEVKDKGRATEAQMNFCSVVKAAGGLAGIVRSEDDALSVLDMPKDR